MSIPKKIHYIWIGPNPPPPELTSKCKASWHKYCPDYEIILWNETNLNLQECNFVNEAYQAKKYGFVSDYFRLKIIYEHGGVYLDTDVELIKPLDDLLDKEGFFGFEDQRLVNTGIGFGCVAHSPLVANLMKSYVNTRFLNDDGTLNQIPCPLRDAPVFVEFGLKQNNKYQVIHGVHFLPREYLCPIDFITGKVNITDHTHSIHHFMGSWLTTEQKNEIKIRQKLCNLFGSFIGNFVCRVFFFIKKNNIQAIIRTCLTKKDRYFL